MRAAIESRWVLLVCGLTFAMVITIIQPASGCMPGYEAERMKLRQYLGIEWVPNGLAAMDVQRVGSVRRAEELNCAFTRPEMCKWGNADVSLGLDSLDFYLFRKEDAIEFPPVQVVPGPSRVAVGDQLLFTGDRKSQEQSAMLVSWPIRCQNSTGRLTFTFWIYNGARVEVLLLEEEQRREIGKKPDAGKGSRPPKLRVVPEKPHVDCGTVKMNTECVVEIPPRETPFLLGIRAYDIRHPEGSFVMLDNIHYEAQLCKVSINFGTEFRTEPLMTNEVESPIQTSSQLTCHDFDHTCRWRNGGNFRGDNAVWRKGTAPPSELTLFKETGTYTAPIPPYAFINIEEGSGTPVLSDTSSGNYLATNSLLSEVGDRSGGTASKMLISDPIQCQAPGGGALSFRPWISRGLQVNVCAMDLDMKDLDCQNVSTSRAPAQSFHQFDLPNREFIFAFRIHVLNPDFDNFAIIDDISYDAIMCSEAVSALDLGRDFHTTPMLSTLLNRPVHMDEDLACDFSRRAIDCLWANVEQQQADGRTIKFEVGLGKIDTTKFQSLTHRRQAPEAELAVAKFTNRNLFAMLISESIHCLLDASTFSFRYWLTGGASLSVCLVKAVNYELLDCQRIGPRHQSPQSSSKAWEGGSDGSGASERIYVDIPPIGEEVRLAVRADSTNGEGIAAVDDLAFKGRMCSPRLAITAYSANSGHGGTHGRVHRPRNRVLGSPTLHSHTIPDENVCRLLSCNFNAGHLCLYTSERVASSISTFDALAKGARTVLFGRSRVAILETPSFHLNSPARLHFNFAIRGGAARLHACTDTIKRELDSCYAILTAKDSVASRGAVVHDFVELLPTDKKLYLIAKLDLKWVDRGCIVGVWNQTDQLTLTLRSRRPAIVEIDDVELTDSDDHRIC